MRSENSERPSRPDWFEGFFTEASQFAQRDQDHSLLETVLKLGQLLDRGHTKRARSLYEASRPQLFMLRTGQKHAGEIHSTQIERMLTSRRYPKDLRSAIRSLLHPNQK